ncbi:hypothetical protein C5167_029683 [Papaver somniferum]|uniref:uncharacterized protein LOC113337861 n=1 Tax=Papaver somniferum TaxID=3469 RepID=UPI000E6F8431|nr:uncharacterized protein LOC113337861 [Papaver somniferum]RZC90548.1 hypothetical protein C5167_029683 [Papaver somniferum]
MMEDDDGDANAIPIQHIKHFLETLAKAAMDLLGNLPKGLKGSMIETQVLQNLYPIRVWRDLIHCNFVVPQSLSDGDGRWRAGAIATLIEIIGACAVYTSVGNLSVSVEFNVSYFSTGKIQEEVEIEAKVLLGHKGNLSSVVVVIKKKQNGDLVAIGKQWKSAFDINLKSHWCSTL